VAVTPIIGVVKWPLAFEHRAGNGEKGRRNG